MVANVSHPMVPKDVQFPTSTVSGERFSYLERDCIYIVYHFGICHEYIYDHIILYPIVILSISVNVYDHLLVSSVLFANMNLSN